MAWSKNNRCSYKYKVTINLMDIVDRIIDNLPGNEDEDWEIDGEYLKIYMSDRALADVWHCRQTLYEPEEYEVELKACVEDDVDVKKEIKNALNTIDDVDVELEIDYESIEIDEDYGPDPDRAYEEWRDRQLEERD